MERLGDIIQRLMGTLHAYKARGVVMPTIEDRENMMQRRLEPMRDSEIGSVGGQQIDLSAAISLKRIADALEDLCRTIPRPR